MSRVLPILFNTDMVQAILDGRKTVTRRALKHPFEVHPNGFITKPRGNERLCPYTPPYQPDDILYVRETWCNLNTLSCPCYYYKASDNLLEWALGGWKPSIHMPKAAARIWLKVTDVQADRLQDITGEGVIKEGIVNQKINPAMGRRWENMQRMEFQQLWDSTIKKNNLAVYGWSANPWVWVIEFERCEKPVEG